MKKNLGIFLLALLSCFLFLAGCGGGTGDVENKDKDITGITFANATYTYDGTEKTLFVTGNLPEGVNAAYTGNKGTDVGVYNAEATLSGAGYNTLTLTATLTIEANGGYQNITGITFADAAYTYDGTEKTLLITGNLPQGVNAEYTNNKRTDAGEYDAAVRLSGEGYNPLNLTAKLTISRADIAGVTISDLTAPYNGAAQSITVVGTIPGGVTVAYTCNGAVGNGAVNAGSYAIKATLTGVNYNTLTLNAALTIQKLDITGVTLSNGTFEYDSLPHGISVVGDVPDGVSVTYTCNGAEGNEAAEGGTYTVVATLTGINYNTLELTATLKINSTEKKLFSAVNGGNVYFQNDLDADSLYSYKGTSLAKVSGDIVGGFAPIGSDLYFIITGLFSTSIKKLSGTAVSTVYGDANGSEALISDGTNLYYTINNLIISTSKNGIYKIDPSSSAAPVRISTDKAEYPVYYNGYIYYSNGGDHGYLYKVSVTASEAAGTLVYSEKVSDIIISGGELYFNQHSLLAAALYKYNLTSAGAAQKLTTDAGMYLAKVGNYLYYVNKDLLTSNLFGDGIYRVDVNASGSLPGTKFKEIEASSLNSDGTNLYYCKLSNKHFYKYVLSTEAETDLMADFVVSVSETASGYTRIAEHNGEVYFTNILDSGALYKYNITSKAMYRVTADSVSNVYFYNGYIYYSTYFLTNYALFRRALSASGETEKISTGRCDNLNFAGNYIYYTDVNMVLSKNKICRMDLDGQNVETLYSSANVHILSMDVVGNYLYFCTNPTIGYKKIFQL
ncbi:MAG: DUF5050 domain-containing protein, partial [Clostridiales bacterium]|nr:DUF5050 domain-containing protein [Clostridiales bacterium]